VARAKELVAEFGGVEATYAAAAAHAARAQAALSGLGEPAPGSHLELLMGLPAYVLERRH
jgi:geranylgeranyl pyrophosphate synthase